jgi:hypothetical protein
MYEMKYDGEELIYPPSPVTIPKQRATANQPVLSTPLARPVDRSRKHFLFYFGAGMCLFLLVYTVWNALVIPWWTGINNQWHYGDSKVFDLSADVGHGGVSHFVAFDSQDEVIIIEVVKKKYIVYPIAELTGSERRMVTLEIVDVNHDGKPDLVVHIQGMSATLVLFNTGSSFSLSSQ